jgi:uncharacterized SAM-dependent methyltransferase
VSILKERSEEIAQRFAGKNVAIIELGSGSSTKTDILLDAFLRVQQLVHYVPIDISMSILEQSADRLLKQYNNRVKITINHGLYQQGLSYIQNNCSGIGKLILFLGSSIGNFSREDAASFLRQIGNLMNEDDRLLIGIDLRKDKSVVEPAYNDVSSLHTLILPKLERGCHKGFQSEFVRPY